MTLRRTSRIHENSILLKWWFGFICVLSAGFAGSLYNVCAKKVTSPESADPLPALYVLMIRQWTVFFTAVPFVTYKNAPVIEFGSSNKLVWTFVTLRSLTAMFCVGTALFSVQRISLPDFATITAVGPFLTSLISWPFLKQRPKVTDFPLFFACLAGATFIVRPDFLFDKENSSPPDTVGCLLAFASVLMESIMFTTFTCLRDVPIASVTTIYGFLTGWIALGLFMIWHLRWPPCEVHVRAETILIGLLGSVRIALDMLASKSLPAAFLALDYISELIFQFLWEILVNRIIPHPYSIIGACIILLAFALMAIRTLLLHKASTETVSSANEMSLLTRICLI